MISVKGGFSPDFLFCLLEQGVLAGHRGECPDFPRLVGVRGVSRAELFVILEDPAVCEPGTRAVGGTVS